MAKYQLPDGQKLATFKIDENDWEAFKALCDSQKISASRTLVSFIEQTLKAGEIDESLLPKPKSSSNDIDLNELEARLMDRIESKIEALLSGK